MSLRQGLAVVLRAIRATKELAQSDLATAADRKYLYKIEQAQSDMTLGKLEEIAKAAGFDAVTLMVLCATVNEGKSLNEVLKSVEAELAEFERLGGLEKLASQVEHGVLKSRASERLKKYLAVQECRALRMTQRETAEKLQLPKSTVADLWKDDILKKNEVLNSKKP